MADFWGNFNEGLNKGVPLGVRSYERTQDEKYRKSAEERADAQDKRAEELFPIQKQAHEQQVQLGAQQNKIADQKQRQDKFRTAYVVAQALANDGKERPAAGIIGQAYNKLVQDGNEAIIIAKADRPDDPRWKDFPEDTQYLVGSPQFGVSPHKSIKEVLKVLEPYALDPEKFMEHERQATAAIDDKNATEKPFRGADNKLYIKEWSMTNNRKQAKVVPYEGPEQMGAMQQKILEAEGVLGRPLTDEEKRVVAELESKTSSADRKLDKLLSRGLIGGPGSKAEKDEAVIDEKRDKQDKEALKTLLLPFGEGSYALEQALDLAKKVESGSKLSKFDEPLKDQAVLAKKQYTKMLNKISDRGGASPVQAANPAIQELKKRGFVQDANGKWIKPATNPKKGLSPATRGY